jgi:hypothetical protein
LLSYKKDTQRKYTEMNYYNDINSRNESKTVAINKMLLLYPFISIQLYFHEYATSIDPYDFTLKPRVPKHCDALDKYSLKQCMSGNSGE